MQNIKKNRSIRSTYNNFETVINVKLYLLFYSENIKVNG